MANSLVQHDIVTIDVESVETVSQLRNALDALVGARRSTARRSSHCRPNLIAMSSGSGLASPNVDGANDRIAAEPLSYQLHEVCTRQFGVQPTSADLSKDQAAYSPQASHCDCRPCPRRRDDHRKDASQVHCRAFQTNAKLVRCAFHETFQHFFMFRYDNVPKT
jgi:hypothetical protein